MKNMFACKKSIFFLFACITMVLVQGCTSSTRLQVLQPAAFSIPDHINSIATINRSVPSKKVGNFIEGLVTGEDILQDRDGAKSAIAGLSEALTRTPRFTVKQTAIELENGTGAVGFPMPMAWKDIEKICADYKVDAVAALEGFDTDNFATGRTAIRKEKNKDGKEVAFTDYFQNLSSNTKLGWRLYDPKTHSIIDEFLVEEGKSWETNGASEAEAQSQLPNLRLCTNETSYAAGLKYGMRIAPTWTYVMRNYYTKGSDNMKRANKLAQANKWDQAAEKWQSIATLQKNVKPKVKGRASYNMAVANEVNGKLKSALEWAEKAYSEYGNKQALEYKRILTQRINQQKILDEQLNKKH